MDFHRKAVKGHPRHGFTLVEMLVVLAIISILMTAGAIGLKGMGGKGVTSGVAMSEALFDEARTTALGRNLRACVLVAKELDNNPSDDLRRILVAYEETDPLTGAAANPDSLTPNWELSSRGILLPDQTYFSEQLSKLEHSSGAQAVETVTLSNVKPNYKGKYFKYVFNGEGICSSPGASFVIGSGARNTSQSSVAAPPRVMASAERDFGGFVVWRNGGTSLFNSPTQISSALPSIGSRF